MLLFTLYLLIVFLMSVIAFLTYGFDKRRAGLGGRRISERSLHLMALFGGWPGALLGSQMFRHKTQKLGFRVVSWLVIALHLSVVGGVAWLMNRGS